ncbi:MAG TPA: rhomboid family intramembrane serine protease [Candidatus Binataceae bacterium]|nr:rhomboid family intramembrane serine protease [Candidatus Binataceae bacterium]
MIPIRDSEARHRFTPVNVTLIAANIAVFVHELSLGRDLEGFVARWAMIPSHLTAGNAGSYAYSIAQTPVSPWVTIFTSMFIHGGLWHVAGNMLYLFIFGAAVEEAMGSARFAVFYFLAGIAAALAMVAFAPHSNVPVIGASGAIAGVLGGYFVLYPRARITALFPVFILIYSFEVPAFLYLMLWFVMQLFWGLSETGAAAKVGGVAWWAHVGGFLFGIAIAPMLVRSGRNRPSRRR